MNNFPTEIDIRSKKLDQEKYSSNFGDHNHARITNLLRKEIYEHLISREDENDYFDLDIFSKRHSYLDCKKNVDLVCDELKELGWKIQLSFGDTGLFIFSTEEKPKSCW
jgi:hypothetical protein